MNHEHITKKDNLHTANMQNDFHVHLFYQASLIPTQYIRIVDHIRSSF